MEKKDQEIFYLNLNEISFYLFVSLGIIHMVSGLMVANEVNIKGAWLINKMVDTPFFFLSYIYIISTIKLSLMKKGNYSRLFDSYSVIIGAILFIAILSLDLIFDNQLPNL